MYNLIYPEISSFLINAFGLRLHNKIVIFESDDWGSIRMPSKNVFNELLQCGIPVDKSSYCKYDSIESSNDLYNLLEILSKNKTCQGDYPKFTMNFVSGNPNFDKIRASQFKQYYVEPFIETYKNLNYSSDNFKIINQGIYSELFIPQFHGRDHVNVPLWLDLLRTNQKFKMAFDLGVFGLSRDVFPQILKNIQATYDSENLEYTKSSIRQGLEMFESQFGFRSKSFIANNYVWGNELNEILKIHGVVHFQTMKYQILPYNGNAKRKMIKRTFGNKNILGQTYSPRNCFFEPTEYGHDHLHTLKQINRAFLYKKPAIISTHRMNFVGNLCIKKRDQNLLELDKLLKNIIKIWPDVKFISSDQMHEIINNLK